MKQKKKVNSARLSAGYKSALTPYENLIDSLRHAYDKIPRIDSSQEKEGEDSTWTTRLATH